LACLQELFNDPQLETMPGRLDLDTIIVLLRLECKTSIGSISESLSKMGYPHHSTGMISERLTALGKCLGNTIQVNREYLVFCLSDEVFALGRPILVTIDPVSTAILRIELAPNRKGETWELHFKALKDHLIIAKGLSSDRGESINKGFQAVFDGLVWCSDHFHEFNDLIELLASLEKQAYAAIGEEEERLRVFNNAKSEDNLAKRLAQYEEAQADCNQKIDQYQHVNDIIELLLPTLYFFDPTTGLPHTPEQVKSDVLALMDLLDECPLPKLQQCTHTIRTHIDDICACYRQVEDVCKTLAKLLPEEVIPFVCLAWQHDHQSNQHKGAQKKYHVAERDFWLEATLTLLPENAENLVYQAFEELSGMVRTSSLIEMVNSQIRPYLNSCKGQVTQEFLNLVMFYHNHHLYKSGKRKDKAPIELFTKTRLTGNWLDRLFEAVGQN
jgi:hypothetical protein